MDKKTLLSKLMEIESSDEILQFKFDYEDQIMWPYIRFTLLEYLRFELIKKEHDNDSTLTMDYLRKISFREKIQYLKQLGSLKCTRLNKSKILFATSNVYNTEQVNGRWFNWLYDPYASLFSNETLILERSYRFRFKLPRFFNRIIPYDEMFIISTILKKVKRVSPADKRKINEFVKYLRTHLKNDLDEQIFEKLEAKLVNTSKILPYETKYWNRLINKIEPVILFLDDGSYGGCSHIYRIAHRNNITCCEFQHGFIDELHLAYNYSDAIVQSNEYQDCLPDYFLTFGEYWNQKNNSSSVPVVIGNSKINSSRAKRTNTKNKRITITFISDYLIIDFFIDLITRLVKEYNLSDKYEILIRPHPNDFNIMEKYIGLSQQTGIKVIDNETIQETLENADIIVSEGSTVIFEALCYNIKLFIRKTQSSQYIFPDTIGHWFNDAEDFMDQLGNIDWNKHNAIDPDYYFNKNWEENYRNFINKIIKDKQNP